MNQKEVIALLEANSNPKGIESWEQNGNRPEKLKSFGIGLTVLRKLAKKIGRNRDLSLELWKSDYYDAKIIALLIDDPKQITKEQAEEQVGQMEQGYLAHVFSSCDASLAKAPIATDLMLDWIKSNDTMRQRCGYGLLYEISKSKKKDAPDDAFFHERIDEIRKVFPKAKGDLRLAMGGALLGIGKRSIGLNADALEFAKAVGPIEYETASGACEPFALEKHLTSDYLKKKLGL